MRCSAKTARRRPRPTFLGVPVKPDTLWKASLCVSLVLAAFGAKLWVIAKFGNATPFWDEWDAQAELFLRYENSSLSYQYFLSPHNEHRLLTARVVSLALFAANDLWDPLLQMIFNAALHVALAVGILLVLGKHLGCGAFAALAALILVIVAVPFAAESVLMSVQTHFYGLLLFGFITICLIAPGSGLSLLRFTGIAAATLSFLSLASGALVFLACAVVVGMKRVLGVEKGWQTWAMAALLFAGFIIALAVTPTIEAHKVLAAQSVRDFVRGFLILASWPFWPFYILGGLLVNVPALLFMWRMLRKPPPGDNLAWVVLALGLWASLQFAALAIGRSSGITASRYLDIVALNVVINFVCAATMSGTRPRQILTSVWLGCIAAGLIVHGVTITPRELDWRYNTAVQQEKNVKAFLAKGQFPPGASARGFSLPYPRSDRLAALLSDESVRRFLPSNLQPTMTVGRRPEEAAARRDRLGGLRDALLAIGPSLAVAGLIAFMLEIAAGLLGAIRRSRHG
jgi:hypothetical protein